MQTCALILFEPGARLNLIKKVLSLLKVPLKVLKIK
jgi:hypothetical protein